MAHEPKIEIYKLILKKQPNIKPVTFREFFRSKFNHYHGIKHPPKNNGDIFKIYFDDFINSIGLKKYKTNNKKRKGFTIATEGDPKNLKTLVSFKSDEMIISGLFYGGRYNATRWLGDIDDTGKKSIINRKNIVSDRFYFLLYTPLDHSEGIILIQGYTESKISDLVKIHLKEYFKYHKEWSNQIEIFIPKRYREEYMKDAKFKKVVFSSSWNISEDGFEDITGKKQHEIGVRIELTDKNAKKTDVSKIKQIINWFSKSSFKMTNSLEKELGDFENLEAKMESNGKPLSFNLDDEDEITPSILLTEERFYSEENVLNFDAIDEFCRNLLKEIQLEILPTNGTTEL